MGMSIFNQHDPRWSNLNINNTSYTVGGYGCLICCVSMVADILPTEALKKLSFDGAMLIWESITNIGLEPLYKGEWDNQKAISYIQENGQCIARVDFDGSDRTDDTHFVVLIGNKKIYDPWTGTERPTSAYSKYTGIRACRKVVDMTMVQVDSKKFDELVTKSTKYDALVSEGISQPQDVQKLKDISNEYRTQMEKAQQEAKSCRDELIILKSSIADKLGSTQDLPRMLGAIDEIINTIDNLTRKDKQTTELIREYEVQVTDLKAEVSRLQLLLKGNNSLSQATMYDMLLELFNRLVRILKVS